MSTSTVGIGRSFFKKTLIGDYSNWLMAFAREANQNCMDCRSNNIWVTIRGDGPNTVATFANDGVAMTRDELVGKLLMLGESGKDCSDTVGGFGAAKLLLYFCHQSYTITSGHFRVVGSGGNYTLQENSEPRKGTESIVVIEGDHVDELVSNWRTLIYMTQWGGTFHLNGQELRGRFRKGHPRRTFSWGTVYTNRSFENRLIVRINGQPMYTRHLECAGRCVLVEVEKKSTEVFTTNRDGLKWEYRNQLDALIDEITVDKQSALQERDLTTYRHYEGKRFSIQVRGRKLAEEPAEAEEKALAPMPDPGDVIVVAVDPDAKEEADEDDGDEGGPEAVEVTDRDEEPQEEAPDGVGTVDRALPLPRQGHVATEEPAQQDLTTIDFVLKNTTGMETPIYFRPEGFSAYSKKLLDHWVRCVVAVHKVFGREANFSVGFVLDQSSEAQYEYTHEYGEVFYINPAKVVRQATSNSRSFRRRFSLTHVGKAKLLADAVHEYLHSLGLGAHDESYANTFTEYFARAWANRKALSAAMAVAVSKEFVNA